MHVGYNITVVQFELCSKIRVGVRGSGGEGEIAEIRGMKRVGREQNIYTSDRNLCCNNYLKTLEKMHVNEPG